MSEFASLTAELGSLIDRHKAQEEVVVHTFWSLMCVAQWSSDDIVEMLVTNKGISTKVDAILDKYIAIEMGA